MAKSSPIKVLIAKVGLDGHDVGAKVVAKALAEAGMEVIYTGRRQTSAMVVNTAVQEDVDVVGISILSGSHMIFFPEILNLLKINNAEDIKVIGGGIIPDEDAQKLKDMGVKAIFPPGSLLNDIVNGINQIVEDKTGI